MDLSYHKPIRALTQRCIDLSC